MSVYGGPEIVSSGLVAYLDAANKKSYSGSGTTLYDLAKSSTATLVNGPTFSSNNCGYIICDGVNDYILTNNVSLNSYFSSTQFSHFTWVYPITSGQIVSELGTTSISTAWHVCNIEISSGGVLYFSTWQGNNTAYNANKIVSATQSFNSWYHLGLTYDGTNLTAYINGISIGSVAIFRAAPYNNGYQYYYALCAWDSTNQTGVTAYSNSRIASFSVYNRGLTASEVSQNFNAHRGRFGV